MKKFKINGNVPSLKNGKIKTKWGLIASKSVQRYMKEHSKQWGDDKFVEEFKKELEGKNTPYRIHMYFIRNSRRRFDFINAAQLPLDLMVKNSLLPDDNADCVVPIFDGYHVDKENAGIEIWIE